MFPEGRCFFLIAEIPVVLIHPFLQLTFRLSYVDHTQKKHILAMPVLLCVSGNGHVYLRGDESEGILLWWLSLSVCHCRFIYNFRRFLNKMLLVVSYVPVRVSSFSFSKSLCRPNTTTPILLQHGGYQRETRSNEIKVFPSSQNGQKQQKNLIAFFTRMLLLVNVGR